MLEVNQRLVGRRAELYSLLGELPDRNRPVEAKVIGIEKREKYVLEKLVLDLNGIEPVPAYFVRPLEHNDKLPVILYNHAHGIYYYVPGLLRHFTTAEINSLIAPRPHLSIAGNYDRLTPPQGLDRIDRELKEVYSQLGCPGRWRLLRYNTGHFETADARKNTMEFLKEWL